MLNNTKLLEVLFNPQTFSLKFEKRQRLSYSSIGLNLFVKLNTLLRKLNYDGNNILRNIEALVIKPKKPNSLIGLRVRRFMIFL